MVHEAAKKKDAGAAGRLFETAGRCVSSGRPANKAIPGHKKKGSWRNQKLFRNMKILDVLLLKLQKLS